MNTNRVEIKEFKDSKIVKATIYGCKYDAIDKLNSKFIAPSTSDVIVSQMYNKDNSYMMRNTYSAIARCMPGDEYDFEVGKRIAMKKLSEKYNNALDRRIARFAKHMSKSVDAVNKYLDKKKNI